VRKLHSVPFDQNHDEELRFVAAPSHAGYLFDAVKSRKCRVRRVGKTC
jgi:hypothetical protein